MSFQQFQDFLRRFCLCAVLALCGCRSTQSSHAVTRLQAPDADFIDPSSPQPERTVAHAVDATEKSDGGIADTLERAWQRAIAHDYRLSARIENQTAAEHDLASASAQRMPLVNTSAGYTVRDNDRAFQFTLPPMPTSTFPFQQREHANFAARVRLPVYTSGRIGHDVEAAQAKIFANESEVESVLLNLKMKVATLYVSVLRAGQEVAVAKSHHTSLISHAVRAQKLLENGRASRNDVLAANVAAADAQHGLIRASKVLRQAHSAYNRQLGRPLDAAVRLTQPQSYGVKLDLKSATATAISHRPEVERLISQIQGLHHQAESIRASRRPQVNLSGDYQFLENRYQSPQGNASVGVNLSWNVFDGGKLSHKASSIDHQATSLSHLLDETKSLIRLEVRNAWLDIQETRRRLKSTQSAIQQAGENLRVAKKLYENGRGTHTNVLDAQALRTKTHRNHLHAQYDVILAQLAFKRAMGTL